MSRLTAEISRCTRALQAAPRSAEAWREAARLVRRIGGIPREWRDRPARDLRQVQRRNPSDPFLRDLLLEWLGLVTARLPGDSLPAYWTDTRPAQEVEGRWYDPEEGMPLFVRHPGTQVELFWIPRIEAKLGPPPPEPSRRYQLPAPVVEGRVAGGGYLGRFPLTAAVRQQHLAERGDAGAASGGSSVSPKTPARCRTHAQALALVRWAGGELPPGEDWEVAGRGEDGGSFPWGEASLRTTAAPSPWWDRLAAVPEPEEDPEVEPPPPEVGGHPETASVFGVEELCGFALEWTAAPGTRRGGIQWETSAGLRRRVSPTPWSLGESTATPAPLYLSRRGSDVGFPEFTTCRLWIPVDR